MKLQRVLFVPDAHIPFHDEAAWALMLKSARAFRPTVIVSIGDLADCCAVSDHSKDPARKNGLKQEVASVNKAIDELDALGAARKVFLAGNHEDRLSRYLRDRAPELFDLTDIPSLFQLRRRGWEYVPYRQHTRLGKLYLAHDVGVAGRFSVYRSLETFEHSVVTGHSHRLAYVVEGNAVGEYRVSAQFGWLGDAKQVDYLSRVKATQWPLGFGVGYVAPKSGIAYLVPVPIINHTCCVEGRLYRA